MNPGPNIAMKPQGKQSENNRSASVARLQANTGKVIQNQKFIPNQGNP